MYFPYLRGKQYELIAIRNLLENSLISSNNIMPIIEPLKFSATLNKTIKIFNEKKFPLAIVINPNVGKLTSKVDEIIDKYYTYFENGSLKICIITDENFKNNILHIKNKIKLSNNQLIIIHSNDSHFDEYNTIFSCDSKFPLFNLIPNQKIYSRKVKNNKVIFEDRFTEQRRNKDYKIVSDEFFSEDHLFFKNDGFLGFSDYITIGSKYIESDFMRVWAVAIHITYFDDDNILRIKHFVSDSNNSYHDVPNKFYEALKKLITWKHNTTLETYALKEFENIYEKQTYPNLGPIKKLSIMHHLELMNKFLDENKE